MTRQPLQFVITTYRRLPGARLSLLGSWGNVPYDSEEAARAAAHTHAAGQPLGIVMENRR
jgi:hypothetical protein